MYAHHRFNGRPGAGAGTRLAIGLLAAMLLATGSRAGPPVGRRSALVVGAQRYGGDFPALLFPAKDVETVGEILERAGYQVVRMTEERGTSDPDLFPDVWRVTRQLDRLLADCWPGDVVLVFLSGHGLQPRGEDRVYFCPAGADPARPESLLPLDEVCTKLKDCDAGHRVLLADLCRNDPRKGASPRVRELESVTRPRGERKPGSVTALYSCSAGQAAWECERLGHGVFAYFLAQGLKGRADANGDGWVTPGELAQYLQAEVPRYVAQRWQARQDPFAVLEGNGSCDLVACSPQRQPQLAAWEGVVRVNGQQCRVERLSFTDQAGGAVTGELRLRYESGRSVHYTFEGRRSPGGVVAIRRTEVEGTGPANLLAGGRLVRGDDGVRIDWPDGRSTMLRPRRPPAEQQ